MLFKLFRSYIYDLAAEVAADTENGRQLEEWVRLRYEVVAVQRCSLNSQSTLQTEAQESIFYNDLT